jgi:hypothetical protein
MKLFFATIGLIISITALAQAPQKISYQAVARQSNGAVISNALIGVKFIIYQGTISSSTISYEETHNANTNQFGLFTLFIGGGSPSIGTFNTINWATGPYFIETQIDPAGGTSYSSIGTQQLMSVPYALFAEKAGNASPTPTININAPNTIANPATGVYNISVPSYTAGTGISISSGIITNTAGSITPTLVAGTNMIVNTIVASNSYTVSSPNYSLSTPSNTLLLLSNGINNSTAIIPAQLLSLSGSTLTSGVPTNSVNLSLLPSVWSNSVGVVYPTILTNSIGIGTSGPLTDKMELNYSSSPSSSHLHLKQTGSDLFSRIKFSNTIVPTKYWLNSVTSSTLDANSGYNFYYNNGASGKNLFTVAGDGKVSVNPFSLSYPALLDVNGGIELDSTLSFIGLNAMPPASIGNTGRFYFDKVASKFMVSENAGAYKPLFSSSPWVQGIGTVALTNINDQVGIGTNVPASLLDIQSTNTSTLITAPILNVVNTHTTYATPTGMVNIQNQAGTGPALYVENKTLSSGIISVLSNTNNTSSAIDATNNGKGIAISAHKGISDTGTVANFYNQASTNGANVLVVSTNGKGQAIYAQNTNMTSTVTTANAAQFQNFGGSATLDVTNNSSGTAIHAVCGATIAGSSNVALNLEDGHLKSTQLLPSPIITSTFVASAGFIAFSVSGLNTTDVKGVLNTIITATSIPTGASATVNVKFNKQYGAAPIVIVTPLSNMGSLTYYISNYTNTSFDLTIKNATTVGIAPPQAAINFSYFVIE